VPTADAPRARELLLAQIGQERRLEARLGRALTVSTVRWIDWFRGQGWARRLSTDECRARGSTDEGRTGRGTERSTRTGRPERCEHAAAVLRAIEATYRYLARVRFDERDLAAIWAAVERAAGPEPRCSGPTADPRLRAALFHEHAFARFGITPLRGPRCLRVPTVFGWVVAREPSCRDPVLFSPTRPGGVRLVPSQDPAADRTVESDSDALLGEDEIPPGMGLAAYPGPLVRFEAYDPLRMRMRRFWLLPLRPGAAERAPPTAFAVVAMQEDGATCVLMSSEYRPPSHCGHVRTLQGR
jgi:hypothetical protein